MKAGFYNADGVLIEQVELVELPQIVLFIDDENRVVGTASTPLLAPVIPNAPIANWHLQLNRSSSGSEAQRE